MKEILFGSWPTSRASIGLLALRLVAGSAMALHGWPKIQNPFGWMGDAIPGVFQLCAALAEFGGGIAWILGALTPLVSLGLVINMLVALFMVIIPMKLPFVAAKPGEASGELAWLYLAIAILFLTAGPGRFSVDYCLFRGKRES